MNNNFDHQGKHQDTTQCFPMETVLMSFICRY